MELIKGLESGAEELYERLCYDLGHGKSREDCRLAGYNILNLLECFSDDNLDALLNSAENFDLMEEMLNELGFNEDIKIYEK